MTVKYKGFTIVELLIVIVVIAILAVISVVAYNGIQSRAYDAAIRSDLRNIYQLLAIYKTETGSYPYDPVSVPSGTESALILSKLQTIDMRLSVDAYNTSTANTNLLYLASNDGEQYALLGYAKGNPTYYITNQQSTPKVYDNSGIANTTYPGGNPGGIAGKLGIPNIAYLYIFVRNGGGYRIWQ